MAIGTTAAIIGASVIGAGASIYSGNRSAKAAAKGADQAAQVQQHMYDTTREDQAPYREVGQAALYKLADMYGVPYVDDSTVNWDAYVAGNPDAMANWNSLTRKQRQEFGSTQQFGKYHYEQDGSRRDLTPYQTSKRPGGTMAGAYGGFQESPGYRFRRDEGIKAVERSAAARGLLGSGGTLKAIQRYGEGLASSEYENYANRLASLAGVGQTATAQTGAAGQAAAGNIGNAYMQAGNARASAYSNTGQAISNTVGNLASAYLYNKGFGGAGMGAG